MSGDLHSVDPNLIREMQRAEELEPITRNVPADRLAPGETSKPRNEYRDGLRANRLVKQRRARKLERQNRRKARNR